MIPSKIEFLRKSYSPFVKEMLDKIGESLAALPDLNCEINDWSHTVTMPRMLSDTESFQIRHELTHAGWGSVLKYYGPGREDLVIYISVS